MVVRSPQAKRARRPRRPWVILDHGSEICTVCSEGDLGIMRMTAIAAAILGIFLHAEGRAQSKGNDPDSRLFLLEAGTGPATTKLWCIGYIRGLLHANEYAEVVLKDPIWCAENVRNIDQYRLVIVKSLKDKPSKLHFRAGALALGALSEAFPCPGWKPRQ